MAAYKDIAVTILILALVPALAIALLLLRDRRTLGHEMSAVARRRAIDENTAKTVNWWHLIMLFCILAAMALNLGRLAHQQARARVAEAAVAAFLIFRYYRKRSEESVPRQSAPPTDLSR